MDIRAFLQGFITEWAWTMTCAAASLIFTIAGIHASVEWQKKLLLALAVVSVFVALIRVWIVEHDARLESENNAAQLAKKVDYLSKPNFVVHVNGSTNIGGGHETLLALAVNVLNKGADSVIDECVVHYHSKTLDTDLRVLHLVEPVSGVLQGIKLSFSNEDSILYKHRGTAIPRGGQGIGRIFVAVSGNRQEEMSDPETKVTVKVKDYMDQWSEGTYSAVTQQPNTIMALPGEKAQRAESPK